MREISTYEFVCFTFNELVLSKIILGRVEGLNLRNRVLIIS